MRNASPELQPDVVVVSHSLTIDYQISILRDLTRLFPDAQLLVEGYDEALDAIANILRAGAKGYFLLSSEPASLLKALTIVHKGRIWAPREAVALMNNAPSEVSGAESGLLTRQARVILNLLQQGLSNKDIARSLGVSEVTVKSHLTKLYRKCGVHTRLELLAYAIDHHLISGH